MKTINLLPKLRQKELFYEKVLNKILLVIWATIFSFVVVVGVQTYAKYFMQNRLGTLKQEIDELKVQVSKKENSETKDKLKALNALTTDYKNLVTTVPKWSKVIESFAKLPPDGVRVSSFTVNNTSKVVTVSGFSPTRDLVIKFYEALKADKNNFYNVDYPLQHIIKAKDVSFTFTFNIQEELLK